MVKWVSPITPPYYDYRNLRNRKCKVNISIGARGIGKTNYWKREAIYHYLNTGRKTIYMRRFKRELKDSKKNFLKDIYDGDERLRDFKLEIIGDNLLLDGEVVIYFIALSTSLTLKSVSFADVDILIYDEFLTLGYTIKGMSEIDIFREFLETTYRDREVHTIALLSNAISTTSEYFELFGFDKPINTKRKYQSPRHSKDVVVEIYDSETWEEHKKESSLMKLFAPSQYQKYAIENEFIFDNVDNILPRKDIKGHIDNMFNLITKKGKITISKFSEGYIITDFIETREDLILYTFDKDLVINNAVLINNSNPIALLLTRAITIGNLYYSDLKVKNIFLEDLKRIVKTFY